MGVSAFGENNFIERPEGRGLFCEVVPEERCQLGRGETPKVGLREEAWRVQGREPCGAAIYNRVRRNSAEPETGKEFAED